MSTRYPDLNEPARTALGNFPVVHLNSEDEYVECRRCYAVIRKEKARRHAGYHIAVEGQAR
jgi:hypothetical protein